MLEQCNERRAGDCLLVSRDGQAPFADVKRAAGRAAVAAGIVQHSVSHSMRRQILVVESVAVFGERQLPRQTVTQQDKRLRQLECLAAEFSGEMRIQEVLNATVCRTFFLERTATQKRVTEFAQFLQLFWTGRDAP